MVYKRRMVRRRRPVRRAGMKAIAKRVVKSAMARKIERKRLKIGIGDTDLGHTTMYYISPLQHIVKGTDEGNRIGEKISNVRLNLGLEYYHNGVDFTGTYKFQGSKLRVLVVKSNRQLTTSVGAWTDTVPGVGSTLPDLFAENYHGSFSPVNTHDYTILYDRTVSSHKTDSTNNEGVPGILRMSVPLAKQWRYLDNSIYGKFNNIYVVCTVSNIGGISSDYAGTVQASGYISWTDA